MNTKIDVWRVVTTFLLSKHKQQKIALFRRCSTMPTYPSHWAGISGTIEPNETPLCAAVREVGEETNVEVSRDKFQSGLYLDVPHKKRIIRVYPFVVEVEDDDKLELRGTEHDKYQFTPYDEFKEMKMTVPGLLEAFHHATRGKYLDLNDGIRQWEHDLESGSAEMARRALVLPVDNPIHIALLRPTMVPIVNAMIHLQNGKNPQHILNSMDREIGRAVDLGIEAIRELFISRGKKLTIATLSRSSTIVSILRNVLKQNICQKVMVATSVPGNEGDIMARDLGTKSMEDDDLKTALKDGQVDLLLFGADCVLQKDIVNKVLTSDLVAMARQSGSTHIYACADRWKIWTDDFPPPMEDIFELVPVSEIDKVLVPSEEEVCLD